MTPELVQKWMALRDDPRRFVRRLHIQDFHNRLRPIETLLPEQVAWFEALLEHRRVLGVKPRQGGWSTITNAFLFWKAYTSRHPRQILSMVHEDGSLRRFKQMVRLFWKHLPPELRAPLTIDNDDVIEFGHNGSAFHRLLAGGGGQARSYTFSDLYATEMGKWKMRTASNTSRERSSTQDETWASALATLHDPTAHIIVESTGAGPFGLYHDLYKKSLDPKSSWHLVFVPWTKFDRYQLPLSRDERRDLEQELDEEEQHLVRHFGVTLEQLAWRRLKMSDDNLSPTLFRREYPITHSEPFLADAHLWFDPKALAVMEKFARRPKLPWEPYIPPQPGRRYLISGDTAGGTGGDESSFKVIRDDLVECASLDGNTWPPHQQAQQVARLSQLYTVQGCRPPVIIEANRFGLDVIRACEDLGLNTWKDDDNDDFWTLGKAAGNTKRQAYVHARRIINDQLCTVTDAPTVAQLQTIVEKADGRIEAPGDSKRDPPIGHDDRADAFVIGLWGAHTMGWRPDRESVDTERDRIRRIMDRVGGWAVA